MRSLTLIASTSILLFTLTAAAAGQQSPPARTALTTGGRTIAIDYSAPSVRGRRIFGPGGLLAQDPTYPVWRAGANEVTTLRTDADLEVGGILVPRGNYSLWVVVSDPDSWQLVVNRQTGQTGLEYDARQDLARVPMTMSRPTAPVEELKYTLTERGGVGELRLEWEQRAAVVSFTVR